MKKTIIFSLCILIGLALVSAAQQEVFVLNLKYDSGNVSVQSFLKTTGVFYPPVSQPTIGYNLSVLTSDNKVLYSQLFDFSLEIYTSPPDPSWFDEQGNQIGFANDAQNVIIREEASVELLLPYYEDAQRIEITDKEKVKILSIYLATDEQSSFIQNYQSDSGSKDVSYAYEDADNNVRCASQPESDYKPSKFRILFCNLRNIFVKEGYTRCLCE